MDELKRVTSNPTVKVETDRKITIVKSNGLDSTTPINDRDNKLKEDYKKERKGEVGEYLTSYLSKLYAWDEDKVEGQPNEPIVLAPKKTEEEKLEDKEDGNGEK